MLMTAMRKKMLLKMLSPSTKNWFNQATPRRKAAFKKGFTAAMKHISHAGIESDHNADDGNTTSESSDDDRDKSAHPSTSSTRKRFWLMELLVFLQDEDERILRLSVLICAKNVEKKAQRKATGHVNGFNVICVMAGTTWNVKI